MAECLLQGAGMCTLRAAAAVTYLTPAAAAAEGDPYARALPEGMRSHDAHQQQHLARARAVQALELHVLKLLQPLLAGPDEDRACTLETVMMKRHDTQASV